MSGNARHHAEWLSLIEVSGPFLTLPVLLRVFPQGLPKPDARKLARLRVAYEEWANAQDGRTKDADAIHAAWIQLVLHEILEFDEKVSRAGTPLPKGLEAVVPEQHEVLRPDATIVEPDGRSKSGMPRMLIATWPRDQDLEFAVANARWAASPLERMTHLCRATGVRLGLLTNGERWTLVDAPVGQTAGYASWYARWWLQEPITLVAFEALLGVRRFFAESDPDTIEALLDESVAFQQEVTDQLGYQVRQAVEVLVQALDRADLDRNRELLRDVAPGRLYDAALTVMMRLVFLFCAEERQLLLLGDETYDANYAVSTLRSQLREEADRVGVEVLERRQDAWVRLLATVRAVHGGIEHAALRLPAFGGSLFDPDRYAFLEGRAAGTSWLDTPASPLPIDNRTVLHLLEALQLLQMRGDAATREARKLSYRALDIEQIGHVYEGLLDHVAVRVDMDTLGLVGTKDREPEISLDELDRERRRGTDELLEFLKEHTGRSIPALRNDLDTEPDEDTEPRLLVACGNDRTLATRIAPYHALLRKDVWGYPQIYRAGGVMVTGGAARRQTGTHYTPKSLTEQIVTETLEPLVYVGPAEGKPRGVWKLRSAVELLDLKICDMAMGSGAFLVQVCQWLGERVVEAWEEAERLGAAISADGEVLEKAAGNDLLQPEREERRSLARRLVAERCIYGVDMNPIAVELAKLSLWLVTLAKGRPFGFLDHNLRSGDSLLGIASLDQLENFHLEPVRGKVLHHTLFDPRREIRAAVTEAIELRQRLRAIRIVDIEDVRAMARLDDHAKSLLRQSELAANLLVATALTTAGSPRLFDEQAVSLADDLNRASFATIDLKLLEQRARTVLDQDCPIALHPRIPFHWVLEFPEVFIRERLGFDALVGNPPFKRGKDITALMGKSYRNWLVHVIANGTRGSADLAVYFILRAESLVRRGGTFGLLATNSISDGDARAVGLTNLVKQNSIVHAVSKVRWPGAAAVTISLLVVYRGNWAGRKCLDGQDVAYISDQLTATEDTSTSPLAENSLVAFQGSNVVSKGFVVSKEQVSKMLSVDRKYGDCVFPLLNSHDLNTNYDQAASRSVINFWDWDLEKAQQYPLALAIVETQVKPERDSLPETTADNMKYKKYWWLHGRRAKDMYFAIGRGEHFQTVPKKWSQKRPVLARVLARGMDSKHHTFAWVSGAQVLNQTLNVFATDADWLYAILASDIHCAFFYSESSTLGASAYPRYIQSNVFLKYPLPRLDTATRVVLNRAGSDLWLSVQEVCSKKELGLTQVMNRVHAQDASDPEIDAIRVALTCTNQAVCAAYGWKDVDLRPGFHRVSRLPENDCMRFTISSAARQLVLSRLIALNRMRHSEEPSASAQRGSL